MTQSAARLQAHLADMMEATRLTGAGRLEEATALIQRTLRDGPAPHPAAASTPRLDPPTLDLTAERVGEPAAEPAPKVEAAPMLEPMPERVRAAVGQVMRGLAPVLKGFAGGPPRSAPGPSGHGGTFETHAYAGPEGARDYKLFVPSRPQAAAPLLVMLHGCTQDPDDFAAGTGMNALAEQHGLFVAYPAQTRAANGQKCWNWFEARDQGRGAGEAAIIAGLTRQILAEHPVDPARVYVAGLSAGGAAAANVARAYPDLYAALGVHSGLAAGCARDLSSALAAMRSGAPGAAGPNGFGAPAGTLPPTIVFHGQDDTTVSARNADQVLAQAGADGLRAERETVEGDGHPFTRTRYRDAGGRVRVEGWRVRGAGHAWSGGDRAGSYTDPAGPDASRAMLEFFLQHSLGGTA